jgi:hypothetical protein
MFSSPFFISFKVGNCGFSKILECFEHVKSYQFICLSIDGFWDSCGMIGTSIVACFGQDK